MVHATLAISAARYHANLTAAVLMRVPNRISLPGYPLSVDPVRLQRVPDAMVQFGLLPKKDATFKITSMTG
jgi:hypothetical protein